MNEQFDQKTILVNSTSVIPQAILENLKKHASHHPDCTCLECGYKGMMGIKNNGFKPFSSAFWALVITFWAGWFGAIGIFLSPAIFGGAWAVTFRLSAKPIVTCPNCGQDLKIH